MASHRIRLGLPAVGPFLHFLTHHHVSAVKNEEELMWCGPRFPGAKGRCYWKSSAFGSDWVEVDEDELRYVLAHGNLKGYQG